MPQLTLTSGTITTRQANLKERVKALTVLQQNVSAIQTLLARTVI